MKTLRFIFNDQLSHTTSCLHNVNMEKDIILMCEAYEEYTYVKHHKKKIAFLISAMRHFADELHEKGYPLVYIKLDDPQNSGSIPKEIELICQVNQVEKVIISWPSEYRILKEFESLCQKLCIQLEILEDKRFLASHAEFSTWAKNRKVLRMEFFYHEMRKKYGILMDDNKPIGGLWNYDKENRKFPKNSLEVPPSYHSQIDLITKQALEIVDKYFSDHFGDSEPFYFAVTRCQALEALDLFVRERLNNFGDYQDAMLKGEPWMYHSHLSFYLNCGLLDPLECIKAAEKAFINGMVSINSAEGFIRQILGWREYVRGIYWLEMPKYKTLNFFNAKLALPNFYWTANTKMNCLKQCVSETKKNAYAHHIQRLMVLGNFALISGINPDYVNEWFLIVYADAYEWVELPNVSGMILFADGGLLGSKPYAASGAYINKMSNYCKGCTYKVDQKEGENACPFNYLYWDFLIRNREKLKHNKRLSFVYSALDRLDENRVKTIQSDTKQFLDSLEYYN